MLNGASIHISLEVRCYKINSSSLQPHTYTHTHTHTHTNSLSLSYTVMYVDVGENRDVLESLSLSFVS